MKVENTETDNFFNASSQQTWIQYTILASFGISVAVGIYFVSKQWYLFNILDTIAVPLLLTLIGSMQVPFPHQNHPINPQQKYFRSYPFRRLLSFNLTLYIFGKILIFSWFLLQNEIYLGAALFLIVHIVYFTGEFLFDLHCHFTELTWDSNLPFSKSPHPPIF